MEPPCRVMIRLSVRRRRATSRSGCRCGRAIRYLEGQGVLLRVNPDIARALKEEESGMLREMQRMLGKTVTLKPDAHLHHEQFDVMAI